MALAALALGAVVIGGVTDIRSTYTSVQQEHAEVNSRNRDQDIGSLRPNSEQAEMPPRATKKKPCSCCAKRIAHARELMRKTRERRRAAAVKKIY
jgi:hypothetical protein